MPDLKETIREEALRLGFSFCGFAACQPLHEWRAFNEAFIREGNHAGFRYIERYLKQRLDPQLLLPSARTVIALLLNYFPEEELSSPDNFIISRYARGKEYQPVVKEKAQQLTALMSSLDETAECRIYSDSGPVLEKIWAQRCGVGWQGKNSLIINKSAGSFFFIGIILTSIELEPDTPETDHCGDCRKCQDACPTGALHTPHRLDIRRCLSYYNIENKEECPESLKDKFNGRIFGCDICQEACPYNRFAKPSSEPLFRSSPALAGMRQETWKRLTREHFNTLFQGSPVRRTGYDHFMKCLKMISREG